MGSFFNPDLTNWQLGKVVREMKRMNKKASLESSPVFRVKHKEPKEEAPKMSDEEALELALVSERKLFIRYAIGVDEHKTSKAGKCMLVDAQRDFVNNNFKRTFGQEAITQEFCNEVKQKVFGVSSGLSFKDKYGKGANGTK